MRLHHENFGRFTANVGLLQLFFTLMLKIFPSAFPSFSVPRALVEKIFKTTAETLLV